MNDCRKCIHFEDVKTSGILVCHTKHGRYIEQEHSMDDAVLLNVKELDIILDKARADERAKVKTCDGCKHKGKWENEIEYGYSSPCTNCSRRCVDNYEVG